MKDTGNTLKYNGGISRLAMSVSRRFFYKLLLTVGITSLIIVFTCYHHMFSVTQKFKKKWQNIELDQTLIDTIVNDKNLTGSLMVGSVNYDEWLCGPFVGYLVDDLRVHHHQWPNHPTNRQTASSVKVYHKKILHMGAKVYGYILPPLEGTYQFRITLKSTETALSGELWISTDSNPMNLIKQTVFTHSIQNLKSHDSQSKVASVNLHVHQKYYFEFHVKGHKGTIDTFVEWKLPQDNTFKSIPSSYLLPAFNMDKSSFSEPLLLPDNLPSNRLQSIGYTGHVTYNVTQITDLNILPECEQPKPSNSLPAKYNPYLIYSVPDSSLYPPDTNKYYRFTLKSKNKYQKNKEIALATVKAIDKLYKEAFNKHEKYRGKVLGVHYLEETHNKGYEGARYLLEMDVQLQNSTVHTSEYVYLNKDKLCHTTNYEWKKNVNVTLVLAIKDIGQWVDHLIFNLEDIYFETKDENFELVIVDFYSKDKDIEVALKESSLPKWKYIPLKGKFHKTLALQTGIDYVKDKNSIVMTIDMHMNFPPNFIDGIRKHTIQGKMAYVPFVFRLYDGYSATNINGYWENAGYGLFSMYKSDWEAVGGWDTKRFKYKWGGEDTHLFYRCVKQKYDVSRYKVPGLFHFHHSKSGLWGRKPNAHEEFGC